MQDALKYKVCILTAGIGSRLGHFSDIANKAVLPVNNKAVISYIVEKFPVNAEFVVAVGHKKDTVIDYLMLASPVRNFSFVEVDRYSGPGSGPGYSLLACKNLLQSPFIFCTADTIVSEDVPPPDENWIGIAPVHETEPYCTVKIKNNLVCQLDNKIKTSNKFAFIGLAGIHDYTEFFASLGQDTEFCENELQMTNGLKGLLDRRLVHIGFTWFDTGTQKNYIETNTNFSGGDHKFDFSKGDEFLYFVNGRVIKFFADRSIAQRRHHRAANALHDLTPKIEGHRGHFYSYLKVPGLTVYNALSPKVMQDFLSWAATHLWTNPAPTAEQEKKFAEACHDFYYGKTKKSLDMFRAKTGMSEEPAFINDLPVPSTRELLEKVDWKHVTDGIPANFHGDLQFDNVLVWKDPKTDEHQFLLLDWRQDFGGLTDMGDLYYDFAKLYGGLILSYPLIKEGMFACDVSGQRAYYHFFTKSDLPEAREHYESFLLQNGFDLKKIKVITALIFLNMAALHNGPFDLMLHSLGRNMLHKALST